MNVSILFATLSYPLYYLKHRKELSNKKGRELRVHAHTEVPPSTYPRNKNRSHAQPDAFCYHRFV